MQIKKRPIRVRRCLRSRINTVDGSLVLSLFDRVIYFAIHGSNDKLLFPICQEAGEKTSKRPDFEQEIAIFFLFSFGAF